VVTLDHGAGLLSSVTGMTAVLVLRGQAVGAGHLLGRAREGLHLGFRQDGTYMDPALLYTRARHAVLVPVPGGG
jgi:septal ring factor EnvC (AmiA/AmiB activator)